MKQYYVIETIGFPGVPVGAAGAYPLERAEVVKAELEAFAREQDRSDTEFSIVPVCDGLDAPQKEMSR
jgi:hypothetical protein